METIGNLIDKLTVTNIRIWMAEDIKRDAKNEVPRRGGTKLQIAAYHAKVAKATEITNVANQQRTDLIQEIDEKINEIAGGKKQKLYKQGATKMYGKK